MLLLAEVGLEPTIDHQALDLAALPICVLGRLVRRAGVEPAQRLRGWFTIT
jgi:hypothetical protein